MINKLCVKSVCLYFIDAQTFSQLIKYCRNNFYVCKFFCTCIVIGMGHLEKPVKQAFAGILFNRFKGFHKPFQEECAEIRECVYLVAVAHIIECKLKAVLNIAVFIALY